MKKKSQIFKNINENEIKKYIIEFMKEYFTYCSLKKEYVVNESIFKHLHYIGVLDELKSNLAPYYYDSKQKYIINMFTYKGFITIIRQLCRFTNISYRYEIIYLQSKYEIKYYFNLVEESNLDNELSISNTS